MNTRVKQTFTYI